MNKRKKEIGKRHRNRENIQKQQKYKRQTRRKKTRRKKKRERGRDKNRKWDLKSGHNGRYNNEEKRGSFSSRRETKKEKTNGMKRGKSLFVGGKRKKMNEKENQKKEDIKN